MTVKLEGGTSGKMGSSKTILSIFVTIDAMKNPIHVDPFSMRTRESSNTAPTVSLSTASGHHSVKLGGRTTHPSQATTGRPWSRNIRIRYSGARRAVEQCSTNRTQALFASCSPTWSESKTSHLYKIDRVDFKNLP